VGQDGDRDGLDVVRQDVVAAPQSGMCAPRPQEVERGSRRDPQTEGGGRPSRCGEVDDVLAHRRRRVHAADRVDHRLDPGGIHDRFEVGERVTGSVAVQECEFGACVGIAH